MSVILAIGSSGNYNLKEVSSSWINGQINSRKKDGVPVCVKVLIKNDNINIALATNDCPCSSGGGRMPNHQEREILELWNKLHLNDANFSAGNLIGFLKQVA
jgi:hypothetical protein